MLDRAYALIEFKSVDEEQRIIEGVASTPEPDRIGDVMEPSGAKFTLPMPFLWQHNHKEPIGHVIAAEVTKAGIFIRAQIQKAGTLPDIDRAWTLIKSGLVRGLSIGFHPNDAKPTGTKYGLHIKEWDWYETSAVTVPMNAGTTIQRVKSIDAEYLAAAGEPPSSGHTPGASGLSRGVVKALPPKSATTMLNIKEQITSFENTRAAKSGQMTALMTKAAEGGVTLDDAQQQEYDGLAGDVKSIDAHLIRLADLEKMNVTKAAPVAGTNPVDAALSRNGGNPVITIRQNLDPGIGMARAVMAKVVAHLDHRYVNDVAKEMWPHDDRLLNYFQQKGNVPAGAAASSAALWAGNLVYANNLESEFIDYLRPMTIIGQFGTNGVPSLTRVPFNIRVTGQTTGGEAWWVGEGLPKPVTSFEFNAQTLLWAKLATIAVITQELARFSSPSAELLVRNALSGALREKMDRDFIDPAQSAVAGVNPASITNGLTALTSAGTSADNVRTDVQNLIEQFLLDNLDPTQLVLIMPNTLALVLSFMVNTLGQPEFPNMTIRGGNLLGLPVIASQGAASLSGSGNLLIAVHAPSVFLADDGQVTINMSTEASLQMLNNPTNASTTATATSLISMFQTNSIALLAERFINWAKMRTGAVVYMDEVNWGAIGSPA